VKVELISEFRELENWGRMKKMTKNHVKSAFISVYLRFMTNYSCSPREIGKIVISWGKFVVYIKAAV